MLLMKIQANREEHTKAGPLRRHTVTGSRRVKEDFSEKVAFEPGFKEQGGFRQVKMRRTSFLLQVIAWAEAGKEKTGQSD